MTMFNSMIAVCLLHRVEVKRATMPGSYWALVLEGPDGSRERFNNSYKMALDRATREYPGCPVLETYDWPKQRKLERIHRAADPYDHWRPY